MTRDALPPCPPGTPRSESDYVREGDLSHHGHLALFHAYQGPKTRVCAPWESRRAELSALAAPSSPETEGFPG